MAFLDEEDQVAAPNEPGRPRRAPAGPERRRKQFLLRRLIAVGVGLVFLILVVIAFRGCLEARSDRGIRNYVQDIGTIMQESQQRGEEFFAVLEGEGGLSEEAAEQRILAVRGASATLLDRAEDLDAPGQLSEAQSAATLALELRRDALDAIADNVGQATADSERADSIDTITTQMGSLYASDILWSQVAVPEIEDVVESEGVDASELPPGNFMPENDPTEFLDQTTVTELLTNLSGEEVTAGIHGLELVQVDAGDTTLSADTTTTVDSGANEVSVQVMNGGDSEETNVVVVITFNGEEETKEIASIAAGAVETANIPLGTLPQPGTETTLDVLVEPVPGEEDPTNNEASYSIVFGSG